ncbi:hypothetical protein C493_14003 [Natronolimnohabitans innermongolicus JCM 12255]|uniref:Uncharacterized protein n=1 Tax=Natronolimnohabitans innermongolicus JCM 12255 TaxID=1227499 RepID=L9WW03_9EURY|nr:hypothetical protein C493_14003 [Natronolimnohabitans innermongolicus JCM 12255]
MDGKASGWCVVDRRLPTTPSDGTESQEESGTLFTCIRIDGAKRGSRGRDTTELETGYPASASTCEAGTTSIRRFA